MKAIAYNIKNEEKEYIVKANAKKHEFTFISNELNEDTILYSLDKDAVIVHTTHFLSINTLLRLKDLGVKQIISSTDKPSSIIIHQAHEYGLLINHIHGSLTNEKKAQQIIKQLDRSMLLFKIFNSI